MAAPTLHARSRWFVSARDSAEPGRHELTLQYTVVVPMATLPADEIEKAAALPSGDAQFTPTLWSLQGPTDVKAPQKSSIEMKEIDNQHATNPATDDATEPSVPLSKNARKRLAKHEQWQLKKKQKKEEERNAKQAKQDEARAVFNLKMESMTEEEKKKYESQRKANRDERMRRANEARAKKSQALTSPYSVVLDLEFGDLMTEKEVKSMAKQLCYCYSSNTKASVPACMYFTGLDGNVGEALMKASPGYKNWAVLHKFDSYIDVLSDRKKDLVYLTADSEVELVDFAANDIYVIGGIVDRNRHKNLTLNKANEQGIRHARLPIRDHLQMSGTHVLTVNQVVDIILAQLELKNWDKAMERAVPTRKHAKEEGGGEGGGDGELNE